MEETSKREKSLNYSYEAEEAKEALKEGVPVFITGNFKEGEDNEVGITAAGGRVLKIGKARDIGLLKCELNERKLSKPLILAFGSGEGAENIKQALISELNELKTDYIISDMEIMIRSGDLRKAVGKAIERAKNGKAEKEIKGMNAAESLQECLYKIEKSAKERAIKTGFDKFDEALGGGLRGGRLYGIGAISSLGKTTFALNIADNIAATGKDILIFSLEMGKFELMIKSISRETFKYCLVKGMNMNNHKARTALEISDRFDYEKYTKEEKEVLERAIERYREEEARHVYISEGIGNVGVKQIRETIDNFIQSGRLAPIVIVDYMQILAPYNERLSDKQNVDRNIMELKRISRDYSIAIIAISSFNRNNYLTEVSYESFKESGGIEYSADVLIGMQLKIEGKESWTDKVPSINDKRTAIKEAKSKSPREIEVIILKNRMYKTGSKAEFNYYPQFDYFKENESKEPQVKG